jgi:hypothetical protein
MFKGHATRFLPGHNFKLRKKRPLPDPEPCACGCGEMVPVRERHRYYEARYLPGHHLKGVTREDHPGWKGGKSMRNGYVTVYMPDHPSASTSGQVLEHRLVMEQVLGRPLEPDELVHHINEDKTDNRPENLQVVTAGEHLYIHGHIKSPPRQQRS